MKPWNRMNDDERFYTLKTMQNCGGSFAAKLADAWICADSGNASSLGQAFGDLATKYGPDSSMYLGPKPVVVNKYNHMYTVAFSIETPNEPEDVTRDELLEGLRQRLRDLERSKHEVIEACGLPIDSYELGVA